MKPITTIHIITLIIVLVSPCVQLASTRDTPSSHPSSLTTANKHIRTKRNYNDADFEPRIIHQPHSVEVKPKKPHTVECPVEAQPEAEVKWFKDDQLVESEPTHLEQTGTELMFFQINQQDSGDYYCQAANYLGSITSKRFRITVQSTIHDANMRLEPQLTEVDWNLAPIKSIELTCTIPLAYVAAHKSSTSTSTKSMSSQLAELVTWRRDGRLLPVTWRADDHQPVAADGEEEQQPLTRNNNNNNNEELFRFEARQKAANEFALIISQQAYKTRSYGQAEVTHKFTCSIKGQQVGGDDQQLDDEELARESNVAKVTVWLAKSPLGSDVGMAPPINDLANTSGPNHLNINQTTALRDPTFPTKQQTPRAHVSSLAETLRDLLELVRPTLLIFAILCLIVLMLLLQFTFIRRKNSENMRYMKHHQFHHHNGALAAAAAAAAGTLSGGSGGSGASSALGGSLDCDPVLSSLLSRTLSGPSASSLAGGGGGPLGKKYKSYRDHMRKVAAANDLVSSNNPDLFLDVASAANGNGYLANAALVSSSNSDGNNQHQQHEANFFANSAILPNLYNQSLAAREQARSLLHNHQQQTNEHMRSLSNLSGQVHRTSGGQQPGISQQPFGRPNGSHLNLPLAFAFDSSQQHQQPNVAGGPLEAGASQLLNQHNAIWPPHLLQFVNRTQQQQQQQQQSQKLPARPLDSEHYQLVSCSSISPSSSSSSAGIGSNASSSTSSSSSASSSSANGPQHAKNADQVDRPMKSLPRESTNSSNHYSVIDTNEDDDRYEVLERTNDQDDKRRSSGRNQSDQHLARESHQRISTFMSSNVDHLPKSGQPHQMRSSIKSSNSSTTSGCGDSTGSSSLNTGDPFTRFNSKRASRAGGASNNNNNDKKYQDQLSPYAVSSICGNLPMAPPPPPVNSEAMRALKEQFDINQLMLLEDPAGANSQHPSLPFNPPPPPSPPPRSDN